jgi:hypothetical protein
LVHFLLALIFNDFRVGKAEMARNLKPSKPTSANAATPVPTASMDDKDEIARRLASLGRVTVRARPQ